MYKPVQFLILILPFCCYATNDDQFFQIKREIRQAEAHSVKSHVTQFDAEKSLPDQSRSRDEKRYDNLRGSFGKALLHLSSGYLDTNAYQSLLRALSSGKTQDFNEIVIGTGTLKLANPQASLAFSLAANDGWINSMRVAPTFRSAETAGEMVELYWTVLVRDVPFNEFDTDGTVTNAIADINTLSDFRGPKVGGVVTSGTFLRGNTPGDLIGPYISQFLLKDIPYGTTTISYEQTVPVAGTTNDFLTTFSQWFTVVNGGSTGEETTLDGTQHFIRTPRDLAEYVHKDHPGQAFYNALLLLNSYGADALDPNNPYLANATQEGFVSYGIGHILELLGQAIEDGLKTAWYQKWQVNRRLRPEEYGFYVQQQIVEGTSLGISDELINSPALVSIFGTYGSYFLPQAYPEGCPTHPSYPAGHATISGACATILKAFYNEDFELPDPVEPNGANTDLVGYIGTLTVGDELNKLAANISLGRDHAGVHYRSDGIEGILLGEKVAIDILNNSSFLWNEKFKGFSFTKFDGTKVVIGKKRS